MQDTKFNKPLSVFDLEDIAFTTNDSGAVLAMSKSEPTEVGIAFTKDYVYPGVVNLLTAAPEMYQALTRTYAEIDAILAATADAADVEALREILEKIQKDVWMAQRLAQIGYTKFQTIAKRDLIKE